MPELSPGLTLTWQIAAEEAACDRYQFIEKEHIFIALCKVCDLLKPEIINQINKDLNTEKLKKELEKLNDLFSQFNIDRKKFRRNLRSLIGKGGYKHTENIVHRSEDCKKYFERAAELSQQHKSKEVNVFHFFIAIMENPGGHISKAFSEFRLKIPDIKSAAEDLARRLTEPVHAIAEGKREQEIEDATKTPFLDKYGRDLTRLAREGSLGPIIERRDETLQIIRALTKKTKNNPVLIGEPGVGKTAIVEGLALRIAKGNLTPLLRNKRVIELSMGSLVAGTKYRGEFEERLSRIIAEASSNKDSIIFIDEIHTLIGAGSAEGVVMDAADIMKPALGRGDITCIGATTIDEYRKYIEADKALERRFQPIVIKEPGSEETIMILNKLYEPRKDVYIEPSVIRIAVNLSAKYIHDRRLPDKAIDVLEEACARVKVTDLSYCEEGGQTETADRVVTAEIVAKVVSDMAGIPVNRLTETEKDRFLNMSEIIKEKVIGQDAAVEKVVQAVRMHRAGLKDARRPVGVFLFLGPTGVGKTELAKAFAEFLFGSEDEIIRLDMSEFMEKHAVSKLIGAPPGYIGHDAEGQLTGRLRSKPHSIVLLDEIEKAHPEILDLFLQVFDEGRLTDSRGRAIDAKNAIFIMTSNIGAKSYYKEPIGFIHPDSEEGKTIKEDIQSQLRQIFRMEFLNRIDEIIYFKPLNKDAIILIALNMLDELQKKLEDKGIGLKIEEKALELICKEGYDPANGARPLKRAIERLIAKPLSGKLLMDEFIEEDLIIVDVEDGKIVFGKGRHLLEKKEKWLHNMETADYETISRALGEGNINEVIKNPEEVAIMFTDLKDCGKYFREMGTIGAMEYIEKHCNILIPVIRSYGGDVVKIICDAIMALFRDPYESVRAAAGMQKAISNHNKKADKEEQYHIRISMNAGRISVGQRGELFGKAINIAARIDKKLTSPDQILIGQTLYEIVKNDPDIKARVFREAEFKEMREKVKVYEVLWNDMC